MKIFIILLAVWTSVLMARSLIYVVRTISEFTAPPAAYQPQNDTEQKYLYYYRSLGQCQE